MKAHVPILCFLLCFGHGMAAELAAQEPAAASQAEDIAPSPELLAALKAAQEAGDLVRQCREGLLATNEVIRALAQKEQDARRALEDFIRQAPVYQDVTQRIARTEARLASLKPEKGVRLSDERKKEVADMRGQLQKDRRQRRLMEFGEGVEGSGDLLQAVADASARLQKALVGDPRMGRLILAHNKAVQAYLQRQEEEAAARSAAAPSADAPPPGGEAPSPPVPSGTP